MHFYKATLSAFVLFTTLTTSYCCSCMPGHPQQHFCNSDFVVLARVKREFTTNDTRIYKIRIRKEYKLSEKAVVALKSGRILTSLHDSMCGITLKPGKLYVIGGKIISLQARVGLCNLIEPWETLSPRQRKGFNRMYHHGCHCNIKLCRYGRCMREATSCNWETFGYDPQLDCQRTHGFCLKTASNKCMWVRNKAQNQCMKDRYHKKLHLPSHAGPGKKFVQ